MTPCDSFIKRITDKLPNECTPKNLVSVGIFRSEQAAAMARYMKKSPAFFKLGGKIIYPKEAVVEWLRENKHESGDDLPKQAGMANRCRA